MSSTSYKPYKPWQVAIVLVVALGLGAIFLWSNLNPEAREATKARNDAVRRAAERERDAEAKKKKLENRQLESGSLSTPSASDGFYDYHGGYESYGPTSVGGPRCKRGKPCGNSCIAVDKTCHK
jgi:cytoskeletal protein RodZ